MRMAEQVALQHMQHIHQQQHHHDHNNHVRDHLVMMVDPVHHPHHQHHLHAIGGGGLNGGLVIHMQMSGNGAGGAFHNPAGFFNAMAGTGVGGGAGPHGMGQLFALLGALGGGGGGGGNDYEALLRLDERNVSRGASDDQIGALPEVVLGADDVRDPNAAITAKATANNPQLRNVKVSENKRCVICLDDLKAAEVGRRLPCGHLFHRDCIDQWLGINGVCPIDKKPIAGDGDNGGDNDAPADSTS